MAVQAIAKEKKNLQKLKIKQTLPLRTVIRAISERKLPQVFFNVNFDCVIMEFLIILLSTFVVSCLSVQQRELPDFFCFWCLFEILRMVRKKKEIA